MWHQLLHRCLIAWVFSLAAPSLAAQDLATGDVDALAAAIRQASSLSEEDRAPLLVSLTEASKALSAAAQYNSEAQKLEQVISGSALEIQQYEVQIDDMAALPPSVTRRLGRDPSLAEIEAEIEQIEAQRRSWATQRETEREAANSRATDDAALQTRLATLRDELTATAIPVVAADPASFADKVNLMASQARRQSMQAEADKLAVELRGAPQLRAIRAARSSWLEASINRADALLPALRQAALETRQSASQQQLSETNRLLGQLSNPPAGIIEFADGNRELVNRQQDIDDVLDAARAELADLRDQLEYIEEDSALSRRRTESAEMSAQIAEVLLTRLTSLPDVRAIDTDNRRRNQRIAQLSVDTIDTEEALRDVEDRNAALGSMFEDQDDWSRNERRVLDRLFDQRRALIRTQLDTQNLALRLMVDGNQVAEQLAEATRDYQALLTGNLLWIRNYAYADPARLAEQIVLITDTEPYLAMVPKLPELLDQPLLVLDGIVLLVALLYRRRIAAASEQLLGNPIRPREESIGKILKGLSYAFWLSLPLPLLLVMLAGAPRHLGAGAPELEALGDGLRAGAFWLFCLAFLGRVTDRNGTGRRLLKWNGPRLEALQRDFSVMRPLTTLTAGLAVYGHGISPADAGGPIAAAATFLLSAATLAYFTRLLMSGHFDTDLITRNALRICVLLAAAVTFMHLYGQVFAAQLYLRALAWSIAAGVGVLLVTSVLQRWMMIYESQLQRQQREDLQTAADNEALATESSSVERSEDVTDQDIDAVASLSEAQSQLLGLARLLTFAGLLWLIWSPALPAAAILQDITLWSTVDPSLPTGELRAVSLATVILAVTVIISTGLLARHLPPLIQIVLMEYGNASSGTRYAAGMLMQYVIIGVGASVSLSLLGFAWSKVQWLVAALGVGIGFGLQEIVANFISGIILLFERPIRPGDIINVGEHEGIVQRINPRATVIETFERKEVIVPNKELITGVVNNWSLSSSTLRGVIPVGIAYGSNVHEAIAILYAVAEDEPRVLDDPPPQVTFEDFGDNALTLWLRCYGTGDYLQLWTDLRVAIYDRLNEAGIGIAYPQRDVHIDAQAPIPVRVVPGDDS